MSPRTLAIALCATLAVACSSSPDGEEPGEPEALTPDLFPLAGRTARFSVTRGKEATLRIFPREESMADMTFEGARGVQQQYRVIRTEDAVFLAAGPGRGTEILRFGAEPGKAWESGFEIIQFDGWERVQVPAGTFDTARIKTRSGPDQLPRITTWWFAPGEGLVKLRSNYGTIFQEEMQLLESVVEEPAPGPAR
jgi:hypothetical protein